MKVNAERVKCIGTLAKTKVLFHLGQFGRLGLDIVRETGWEEQRSVEDVVVRGEGGEVEFWLVHLLKLTKFHKLAADVRTELDGAR